MSDSRSEHPAGRASLQFRKKAVVHKAHCPRCNKPFQSIGAKDEAMKLMLEHVKLAHEDYQDFLNDD